MNIFTSFLNNFRIYGTPASPGVYNDTNCWSLWRSSTTISLALARCQTIGTKTESSPASSCWSWCLMPGQLPCRNTLCQKNAEHMPLLWMTWVFKVIFCCWLGGINWERITKHIWGFQNTLGKKSALLVLGICRPIHIYHVCENVRRTVPLDGGNSALVIGPHGTTWWR